MFKSRRSTARLVSAVAIVIAVVAVIYYRNFRVFQSIRPGDAESAVVAKLGAPDWESGCGGFARVDPDGKAVRLHKDELCASQAFYEKSLTAWTIAYTTERRVLRITRLSGG
jgi:hypothetical protein